MHLGYMDDAERQMLHDLVFTFIQKLNAQQRLSEDLARKLDAANERLSLLDAQHYGVA